MSISTDDLQKFLVSANVLQLVDNRWHPADSLISSKRRAASYSTEELAILDSRLPSVLAELGKQVENTYGKIPGCNMAVKVSNVLETLDYWSCPKYVKAKDSGMIPCKYLVEFASPIEMNEPLYVPIWVVDYVLATCKAPDGQDIQYVADTTAVLLDVERAWLDTTYPGWEQKRHVAESLGYQETELMNMIFSDNKNTEIKVTLGNTGLFPE